MFQVRRTHQRAPSCQPHLEALEQRVTPVGVTFIDNGGFGIAIAADAVQSHFTTRSRMISEPVHSDVAYDAFTTGQYLPYGGIFYSILGDTVASSSGLDSTHHSFDMGTLAVRSVPDYGSPLQLRIVPTLPGEAFGQPVNVTWSTDILAYSSQYYGGSGLESYRSFLAYQGQTYGLLTGSVNPLPFSSGDPFRAANRANLVAYIGDIFSINLHLTGDFQIHSPGGFRQTDSQGSLAYSFDILPVPGATHFSVVAPSHTTAGQPFSITVAALDAQGNTDTGCMGTAHFTASDQASGVVLPPDYAFTAADRGVHTFTGVQLVTPGSQSITATDTATHSITGTANVSVNPNIRITDAVTRDFQIIEINYSISGADAPAFSIRAYVSPTPSFDPHTGMLIDGGDVAVTDPEDLTVGPHEKTKMLRSRAAIDKQNRFVVLVAEIDPTILGQNFVLPLISGNAGFLPTGQFQLGNVAQRDTAGTIGGRVARGSTDFQFFDFRALWQGFGGRIYTDYDPYAGDESLIQPDGVIPLQSFGELVASAIADGRLRGSFPGVTAAFDEKGKHTNDSPHYEGRAIDFSLSGNDPAALTGLELLAGFDWVNNESTGKGPHVHASFRGWHADVSPQSIIGALDYGWLAQPKLITNPYLYNRLRDGMASLLTDPPPDEARAIVLQFLIDLYSAPEGELLQGFRDVTKIRNGHPTYGLLAYNAMKLLEQYPPSGTPAMVSPPIVPDLSMRIIEQTGAVAAMLNEVHQIRYSTPLDRGAVQQHESSSQPESWGKLASRVASERVNGHLAGRHRTESTANLAEMMPKDCASLGFDEVERASLFSVLRVCECGPAQLRAGGVAIMAF